MMATLQQSTELEIRKGIRSSVTGIVDNLSLALVKCLAGVIGHSLALVADGIESFSDVVSSSVVAVGLWVAIKPRDQDHPYGHAKAEADSGDQCQLGVGWRGNLKRFESLLD